MIFCSPVLSKSPTKSAIVLADVSLIASSGAMALAPMFFLPIK
jgi:hypothetical protein